MEILLYEDFINESSKEKKPDRKKHLLDIVRRKSETKKRNLKRGAAVAAGVGGLYAINKSLEPND